MVHAFLYKFITNITIMPKALWYSFYFYNKDGFYLGSLGLARYVTSKRGKNKKPHNRLQNNRLYGLS